jgi:hypothetical protein
MSGADALELTLIYLDTEPARYERAALRWHQRFTQDARLSLDDSLAALGLLAALRGRRAQEAAHALASLAAPTGRFARSRSPGPVGQSVKRGRAVG